MGSVNLKKALAGLLSADELSLLIRGYDVIGDICVIIIPDELAARERAIALAVLAQGKGIRLVAKRVGHYGGEFRTIQLQKIAGAGGLETLHKEYGVSLLVAPEDVYFSPRSDSERYRVATAVAAGEDVLVMFSGIAPLPLMISRHSKAKRIVAIEKNPAAHALAQKNLALNKKTTNIHLLFGDVREVSDRLEDVFDRVAMVLPSGAAEFLDCGLQRLRRGGILHFYDFSHQDDFDEALSKFTRMVAFFGREVQGATLHRCGHVAPGKYRICIDAEIG